MTYDREELVERMRYVTGANAKTVRCALALAETVIRHERDAEHQVEMETGARSASSLAPGCAMISSAQPEAPANKVDLFGRLLRKVQKERERAEAAEARVAELEAAMVEAMGWLEALRLIEWRCQEASAIARAALSPPAQKEADNG